jgi:folate-binding protein YgfZ
MHRALGARFDAEATWVLGYGETEAEYQALGKSCGLYDRSAHGFLRITRSERISFLHGMVTSDVKALADGRTSYALFLTAQGKLLADARILRRAEELLIDLGSGLEGKIAEHLDRLLISEDVEIANLTGKLALLSFIGPRAHEAVLAALPNAGAPLDEHQIRELEGGAVLLVGTRIGAVPGVDLIAPPERARAIAEQALAHFPELKPVGFEALEIRRVEAGLPRYGQDMTEETPPLEASLERAISYNKGCYVGQEAIARATYRGAMRRKLAGLSFDGDGVPQPGTELFKQPGDSKSAATITSAVRSPRLGVVCLGYVRREHLMPGTRLLTAEGRGATVYALPFAEAKE